MPISQQELGVRLKVAREAAGVTQEEAAGFIDVARPTIAQIEAGIRAISSVELDMLAFKYGRDIREFFGEQFNEEGFIRALFRTELNPDDRPVFEETIRRCIALGREMANLEKLLGVERIAGPVPVYQQSFPQTRYEAIQQGERLALAERHRLNLGNGPLPNLIELLYDQGIRTAELALPDSVSGLTLNTPGSGLIVVVNSTHHFWRRRFSFAHEYCHVLADRDQLGTVSQDLNRNDTKEVRANAFAASFLMPEEGVREYINGLGKGQPSRTHVEIYDEHESVQAQSRTAPGSQAVQIYDVAQIAHYYSVSRTTALYRLKNLKLVSDPEFEKLKEEEGEKRGKEVAELMGLNEPDPKAERLVFRRRFLGLGLEAVRREKISRSKFIEVARHLELSRNDAVRLLIESGLEDETESGEVLYPKD